jgi:hypothetical protein
MDSQPVEQVPAWGAVLKVSASTGELQQWLVDLKGETVSKIPSAHEDGDRLFFGNLAGDYVSFIQLSDLPPDMEGATAADGTEPLGDRTPGPVDAGQAADGDFLADEEGTGGPAHPSAVEGPVAAAAAAAVTQRDDPAAEEQHHQEL